MRLTRQLPLWRNKVRENEERTEQWCTSVSSLLPVSLSLHFFFSSSSVLSFLPRSIRRVSFSLLRYPFFLLFIDPSTYLLLFFFSSVSIPSFSLSLSLSLPLSSSFFVCLSQVLLGDSGVGKSSLALRFCRGRFPQYHEVTIGAAFLQQTVRVDKEGKNKKTERRRRRRTSSFSPSFSTSSSSVLSEAIGR